MCIVLTAYLVCVCVCVLIVLLVITGLLISVCVCVFTCLASRIDYSVCSDLIVMMV
jgi:hypothetical protein